MNMTCRLFGHRYSPVITKQTDTFVDGQEKDKKLVSRTWEHSIVCSRCGGVINPNDSEEGDND